jgi:hypothetical protein
MCGECLLPPLSKVRAVCGNTACTDLRGGRRVIGVPTATIENADPIGKSLPTTPYHLDGFACKTHNRLRKLLPTCTRIEASK